VEGWSVTFLWEGVPISELLAQTGVSSGANTVIFVAADGYTSSLPLQYVTDNNIMVAYKINNITLTDQTGWPLFVVAKNQYGYKWVEWVTEINVSNDANYLGYWESRGYPNDATVGGSGALPLAIGSFVLSDVAVLVLGVVVAVVVVLVVFGVRRFRRGKSHL
jgi:DMSO/TMAO reductase YedYZ molybdopterin-dependent catalytic subunit